MLTMRGRPSANTVPETAARLALGDHRHGDQALVVAVGLARRLLDDDAALLGDDRRGDDVDSCSIGRSRPAIAAEVERLGVHAGDLAFVGELHLADAGLGQLAGERAELLRERDERLEPRRLLGGDRGKVDGVGDRAAQQIVRHLLGDLQRDVLLRLGGRGAEMRRAHHVGMPEQRVLGGRLLGEYVEGRAGDMAGIERSAQRHLVDQPAARAIDDAHALLHRGERLGVDDVLGLLGQRRVQGDEIGAPEQLVELDLLDAEIARRARATGTDRRRSPSSAGRSRGWRRSSRYCRSR